MNNNKTIVNAQKLAKYQAVKRQTNKLLSEVNSKDVVEAIQYTDENTLIKGYLKAVNEVKNLVAKVDEQGNAISYQERKDELKAKKESTSLGWLCLPVVGAFIYLILWGKRRNAYTNFKNKMDDMTKEALSSLMLAQPTLIDIFEKNLDKLPSKANREAIQGAINMAKELIKTAPEDVKGLREMLTDSVRAKISKKVEDAYLDDLIHGKYDQEKIADLINNNYIDIFGKTGKEGKKILETVKRLHNSLETPSREGNKLLLSNIDEADGTTPNNKKETVQLKGKKTNKRSGRASIG